MKSYVTITGYRMNAIFCFIVKFLSLISIFVLSSSYSYAEQSQPSITVYKSPTCGCCNKWIKHLENNNFDVISKNSSNMPKIKSEAGVIPQVQSCHTGIINGYYIEGHVPADDIKRLIAEKPKALGLSVPGMPMGSPGMEGHRKNPYTVILMKKDGSYERFSEHN